MSAPIFSAKRRSLASFSVSAGRGDCCTGQADALLLERGPPDDHAGANAGGSTYNSLRRILPSSSRSLSPSFTSPGRPLCRWCHRFRGNLQRLRK